MVRVCAKAITIVNNCVVIIFLNSVSLTMIDDVHVIVRIYEKSPPHLIAQCMNLCISIALIYSQLPSIQYYGSKIITCCYLPIDAAFDTFHHSFTIYLPFFFSLFRNSKTGLTSKLLFK